MKRCDVEIVGEVSLRSMRKRGGESLRSLRFEIDLGSKCKGLQDLINSVNSRTLFPKRSQICGFNNSVSFRMFSPQRF